MPFRPIVPVLAALETTEVFTTPPFPITLLLFMSLSTSLSFVGTLTSRLLFLAMSLAFVSAAVEVVAFSRALLQGAEV